MAVDGSQHAAILDENFQIQILELKESECMRRNLTEPVPTGLHCPLVWDGIYCWPNVRAGTVAEVPCPSYIVGFLSAATATRTCMPDGTWYIKESSNMSWSNYTRCAPLAPDITAITGIVPVEFSKVIRDYFPVIKTISKIGYTFSLTSLLIAFLVLAFIKRLRCPRNNLHMHLFASFIFRAFITLLKDNLMIKGLGLATNLVFDNGEAIDIVDDENWDCKLLISVWQYFLVANYFWILMEGLYLHNLIFLALFSDSTGILLYVLIGWGMPMLFVLLWAVARAVYDNALCWTKHDNKAILWITRGPITVSIVINFIFFLNIIRILFLKLKTSYAPDSRNKRFRKLARSTLVLVPLFGIHYMLFLGMSTAVELGELDELTELSWLFCDQSFTAFQGFFVAILYCFMNGEVQAEVCRKWQRWNLARGQNANSRSSMATHSLTYFSKTRNSLHSLTTSTVIDPLRKECSSTTPSPNFSRGDRQLSCLHRSKTPSPKGDPFAALAPENSTCTTWSYCQKLSDGSLDCDKLTVLLPCPSPANASNGYDLFVSPTPTLSTPVADRLSLSPMTQSDTTEDTKLLASPSYDYGLNNRNESTF